MCECKMLLLFFFEVENNRCQEEYWLLFVWTCNGRSNICSLFGKTITKESMLKTQRWSCLLGTESDTGNCFSVLPAPSLECVYQGSSFEWRKK